jgi:hypothetical protein
MAPLSGPEPLGSPRPVRARRSSRSERKLSDGSSLRPELLSGRSLEPPRRPRREVWRERRKVVAVAAVVLVAVVAVLAGKFFAERSADRATERRAAEIGAMLEDAGPEDFLAFNAGVKVPGSLAHRVRNEDGFVNLRATADRTFIRIQPSGWWAGFTERCLVVDVGTESVVVTVPKRSCVRVTSDSP